MKMILLIYRHNYVHYNLILNFYKLDYMRYEYVRYEIKCDEKKYLKQWMLCM